MQQCKDGDTDGYTFSYQHRRSERQRRSPAWWTSGYDAFEPVAIYGIQSGENIVVPADAPYDSLGPI